MTNAIQRMSYSHCRIERVFDGRKHVEFTAFSFPPFPLSVHRRWSEPSSSSQSTEGCRYAAWRKSTACPAITERRSRCRRGAVGSASASTSPTDTHRTTPTPRNTAHTAGTPAWAEAASCGWYSPPTQGRRLTPTFLGGSNDLCVCVLFLDNHILSVCNLLHLTNTTLKIRLFSSKRHKPMTKNGSWAADQITCRLLNLNNGALLSHSLSLFLSHSVNDLNHSFKSLPAFNSYPQAVYIHHPGRGLYVYDKFHMYLKPSINTDAVYVWRFQPKGTEVCHFTNTQSLMYGVCLREEKR